MTDKPRRRYKTKHEKLKELLTLVLNSKAVEKWVAVPEVAIALFILLLEVGKQTKWQLIKLLEEIK